MKLLHAVAISVITAFALSATPAYAEKPEWAGEKGKGHNKHKSSKHESKHFQAPQRDHVRVYYEDEFRGGKHCPPGLRKKNNGCMPPGQAKKWQMGKPIPAGVVVYDLPPPLVVKIGVPPPGYKYVRVASDILMIAIGTSMVVDAITDLGRI